MMDKEIRIIRAALKLFTEKGIDSTSTASIAREAGVGTGTVFHYFSTKDELIDGCFLYVKKDLQKSLRENSSEDFMEQARLYWETSVRWFLSHRMETSFLTQYQSDPKKTRGNILSTISEISSVALGFMKEGIERGIFKGVSADYLCILAHQSTILSAQHLYENPEIDEDEFIASTFDLFIKGVALK